MSAPFAPYVRLADVAKYHLKHIGPQSYADAYGPFELLDRGKLDRSVNYNGRHRPGTISLDG